MCGIFGIFSNQLLPEKREQVRQAVFDMRYRGPDEDGFYDDDSISLGISRLAIVDVKGGQQPHTNTQGDLVLICNGQIYNHIELRQDLEQKGHSFKTGSDTEVILHLYEEKGVSLLEDLAGMFAFALWDRQKERLFLARDRVGIKPLYIHKGSKALFFSSEMSSLVRSLNLEPQMCPEKIWEFLSYGFPVDNRQTVHQNIIRLQPGEGCLVSRDSEKFFTYWKPDYNEPQHFDHKSNPGEIEKLYGHSLCEHLTCEVPYAVMLSGGLDSTSIVSLGHTLGYRPRTITVGYDGNFPGDERAMARQMADMLRLEIDEVILNYEDYEAAFKSLMRHSDEPVADIAAIPQWKIFEYAKGLGLKVLINGLGGDEIFYGYGVWNEASDLLMKDTYQPSFLKDDVSGFFYHPAYRAARKFLDQCSTSTFKEQGLGADLLLYDRFDGVNLKGADRIYHLLFKTWLPNNCLLLADRLSMAHSIELRVPMLDHRLVEYVQSMPHNERFFGNKGKVILKKILEKKISSSIIERPKQGFTPPGKYMKKLVASNRDIIFDSDMINTFFDKESIEKLWANDNYLEIWFRLLVFAKWQQNTFN